MNKPSAEEHEDALNLFIRDNTSEDDDSDSGPHRNIPTKMSEDASEASSDQDWEDIDLTNNKTLNTTEPPDLEVTLERTQQSMRIKLSVTIPD